MAWFDEAKELKSKGLTLKQISEQLGVNYSTVRARFSKERKKESDQKVEAVKESQTTDFQIKDKLLKELKKAKTLDELLRKTPDDVDADRIINVISSLENEGYVIDKIGNKYVLRTSYTLEHQNRFDVHWNGDKIIRFGIVSDPHLTSKYQQLTHLNTMYDIFVAEGIDTVYNPGDILEGEYHSRKGHVYEIFKHGADEQVDYAIEKYPKRKGVTTYFITGNHDHTHLKNAGYDIGRAIARERDDMVYLGMNNASIYLTPNCRMDSAHPLDGAAYALSYSLQKTIEATPVDDLPQIYISGHHHKSIYLYTRGIHALEAGTFQAQTPWMKGKRLPAHVGGWIVTVHVNDEGIITRFIPEWVPFPKSIKNDY